jgi:hypothetical protein
LVKIGTAAIAMLPIVSTAWASDFIALTCGPAAGSGHVAGPSTRRV